MTSSIILTATTLADRIKMDFSKVKLKKAAVKVPKLKVRKRKVTSLKSDDKIPISSIINILIKTAVEKSKREKKEKVVEKDKSYNILKDENEQNVNGGYGTVSKGYDGKPRASYVDYEKLFSYLGKFKSQSAYENIGSHLETLNKAAEGGSFALVDRETMDKGARYVKYFHSKTPIDKTSLVPIAGMSSAEWEEFKRFMRFDTVMYLLKTSTS